MMYYGVQGFKNDIHKHFVGRLFWLHFVACYISGCNNCIYLQKVATFCGNGFPGYILCRAAFLVVGFP